jgi:uncharacterized repeat protein (TIGR01451 family)
MRRQFFGLTGFLAATIPVAAQTFEFRQPQHSFISASGASGVLPDYSSDEIDLDRNRDGLPDGTWNLPPEIRSIANTTLQHRLSPSQRYLITMRSAFGSAVCGGAIQNVAVFFHRIDSQPVLVLLGSDCLRGPVSIGPLWWDQDAPPTGMPITSMVVGGPDASAGIQPVLWADLASGEVGVDSLSYEPNVSVTAEGIRISPLGNAVFVRHGTSTSFPDRFSMVDLCASPVGGNVSTQDEPASTTRSTPRLIVEGSNLSAQVELLVAGAPQTRFFELDDCPIAGPPPPPPPPDPILTVIVTGTGTGSVGSLPAGIQCPIGGTCNASFARNTVVTVQALTGAGTGLIAWGGDCSGTALTSNVLMSSDRTCTATFGGVALAIEKTAAPASVRRSEELLYTITFRNTGSAGATGVQVRDTVPSGSTLSDAGGANVFQNTLTWNVGSLPPGGSGQRQFRVIAQCSASELRNSAYSIASTQFPLGVNGAPVVTPVLAASTAPVGVVVSSVPARTPLRSGDLVTHTVTLTNTIAEVRRRLRFLVNPGGDAAFDSVLDPGTGTIEMTNPFNWVWTGDLGPNASTDVVFTTRIDQCIQGREVALNNGTPIGVQNSCGVPVGESNAPLPTPLDAAVAIELRVLGLPPERLVPPNLLVRPNETFQLQSFLVERHGQDQASVSIDLPIPAGLSPVGDPPFAVPTDPAATWDPGTETASWSGTVPANGTVVVTVEVRLDVDASCRVFPRVTGRSGTCSNLSAGLNVLKVPEPPAGPYLMGLDRAAGLFVWEPGVDRNFAEHLCLTPVEVLVDMDLGDGNQVAVSGLPAFLFDSDPTSLEIQKPLFGGPFLGVDAEPAAVAHDPTTNTWVYAVQEGSSSRPNSLRRLDATTGQFTIIANGLPWLADLQIEPDGTIAAIVIQTGGSEIWRIDPSDPSSPEVIADPAYPFLGQLALDPGGGYVAIHIRFNGMSAVSELVEIDPAAGSFTTLVGDLDAFLGLPVLGPYAMTVAASGEIHVANRRGAVGVIERTPTLSGRLLADSGTVLNPRTSGRLDDNYTALLWVDPGGAPPSEEADLELTKTASSNPVAAGASLVYTLGVTNHGPDAASAVSITDPLPAGVAFDSSASDPACSEAGGVVTCDAGDLAPGAGGMFALGVTVGPGLSGDLANTAVVTSDTVDPDPSDNDASVRVTVLPTSSPEADLSIVKTASPNPALLGAPLTYTLAVTNDGPDDASNVRVTDTLPAGVRFDASTSTQGCTAGTGTVTCDLGALAPGAEISANVVVVPELASDLAATRVEVLPDRAVRVGDSVLYRIEVTNHGPGIGNDVRLFTLGSGFDDRGLPLGPAPALTALSVIPSRGVCSGLPGSVPLECRLGDLLPGETAAIDMAVRIDAPSGSLPRSVGTAARVTTGATVATGIRSDPNPANDELGAGHVVAPSSGPDLRLRSLEVVPADPIALGGSLTYTIEIENLGPVEASNVVLHALARGFDSSGLPDGPPLDVTLVSAVPTQGTCTGSGPLECALGLLPVGASASLQIVVTPTVASVGPGQPTAPIAHRARVAATADPNPTNDEAGVDAIVLPAGGSADLSIAELSFAPKTPILLGQSLTYTIEVTNFGPDDVSDTSLVALARSFDGSGMPIGPSLDVKIDSVVASQGACIDVGGAESGPLQCDLGALAFGATATVTIQTTPRSATVTAGQAPTPLPHAARIGSSTADFHAANDESTVVSVVLPERPSALLNRATVSGNLPDPDSSDDSDTISTPLAVPPLPPTGSANVTLALGGPGSGTAGQFLPFTIDVTNSGPDTAAAARVVIELSPGLALFSLATNVGSCAGATVVVCELGAFPAGGAALLRLDAIPLGAGTHQLEATVSSSVPDPAPADNSAALTVVVGAGADLELAKSTDVDTVSAGGTLTYELAVTNRGPSAATRVVLDDALPAALTVSSVSASQGSCQVNGSILHCELGTLTSSASANVTLVTIVLPATADGSVLVNDAEVFAAEPDPAPANNLAAASVSVAASADLSIQKTGPAAPVPSRDPVHFELTVRNEGPSAATSVSVVDPLPAGATFDAAGSDPRCIESAGSVTCVIGDLPAGAAAVLGLSLNAGPGTLVNVAMVTAVTGDPDPSDNTDTASATVFLATDENMDPGDSGAQYAWSETLGWLNLEPGGDGGSGLEVTDTEVRGYLWGENFGWCSLSCQNTSSCAAVDYEVSNDGQGDLAGFAWCENVGWLSFSCESTSSCGRTNYGVRIDPATGVFSGEAWGENVGWISFSSSGAFEALTSWRGAPPPPPLDEMFAALRGEVSDLVDTGALRPIQGTALILRLYLAELFTDLSRETLACSQLQGFERTVRTYRTFRLLSDEQAASLDAASGALRARIGC